MKLFPALALVAAAATVSRSRHGRRGPGKPELHGLPAVDKAGRPAYQGRRRQVRRPEGRCRQARAEGDQGGVGVWGQIPMPANAQVNDAGAKAGRLDPDPQSDSGSRLIGTKPRPVRGFFDLDQVKARRSASRTYGASAKRSAVTSASASARRSKFARPSGARTAAPRPSRPGSRCRRSGRCWPRATLVRARLRPGSAPSRSPGGRGCGPSVLAEVAREPGLLEGSFSPGHSRLGRRRIVVEAAAGGTGRHDRTP